MNPNRLKIHPGDYTVDDLPKGFDLVFLSAVIHSNSLEINQNLLKKCFYALNNNGRIIIQDWIMNDDRTQPAAGAIFAINMLVGTEGGDCFTEQEVRSQPNMLSTISLQVSYFPFQSSGLRIAHGGILKFI